MKSGISYLDLLKVLPVLKTEAISLQQAAKLAWPDEPADEALTYAKSKIWQMVGEKLVQRYSENNELRIWISRYGKQRLKELCS